MMPVDARACVTPVMEDEDIFAQPYWRFVPLLLLPMATMPLSLYWLYKRRYYAYLSLTLLLFFLLAVYLMLRSSGNPLHTLLWFEMLFGFLYLPFALWGWINHKIATALLVPIRLGAWPVMVLIVLALALQILFMVLWNDQEYWVTQWLNTFDIFFNRLFQLHEPIYLAPHVRSAGFLMALLPTVTLLNLTQIWWKKRAICNRNPTSWWMLLLVLLILSVALWSVNLHCDQCFFKGIVNM